ncbi:MAG: hypothetical protein ACFCD0_28035 [Gemmataceae bacterium]
MGWFSPKVKVTFIDDATDELTLCLRHVEKVSNSLLLYIRPLICDAVRGLSDQLTSRKNSYSGKMIGDSSNSFPGNSTPTKGRDQVAELGESQALCRAVDGLSWFEGGRDE